MSARRNESPAFEERRNAPGSAAPETNPPEQETTTMTEGHLTEGHLTEEPGTTVTENPPATAAEAPASEAPAGGEAGAANGSNGDGEANPLRERVVEVLQTCYDPEIPVDIHELGLVYRVGVEDDGKVEVEMTLTSPACPVAGTLPPEVEQKIGRIEGVSSVRVDLVWDPPWNPDRMSDAAKLKLGLL